MALAPPDPDWSSKPLGRDEKLWSYLMIIMLLMMGIMAVGYVYAGDQNPPEDYTTIEVENFEQQAHEQNNASDAYIATMSNGNPAVALDEGGDIYMVAKQWAWTVPFNGSTSIDAIRIQEGVQYRLHLGSVDVLHGFQVMGADFILTLQVVPGYDYILDFVPNETGLFRIVCNEFCGPGHQSMMGMMEVV